MFRRFYSSLSLSLFCTRKVEKQVIVVTPTSVPPPVITWKETSPFVAPIDRGQVIKVYDGDTITIAAKLPYESSPLYRFSVRLNGIDCPEIKGKNADEKSIAQLAKEEMTRLVLHKEVTLKNTQTEKYGRILADVYVEDVWVNEHLLKKRLAVVYDGGTKKSPESWAKYHEENDDDDAVS